MRAVGKKVIVRQDPPTDKIGRFFVPQGKEQYDNTGTILSVGPEVQEDLEEGMRIVFQRKPATAVDPDAREGSEYWGILVLPEDCILAVLEDS